MEPGLDCDVAVLGGGLAGLSLAVRLAGARDLRVVVLEPRAAYSRDRTWCYWHLLDHPFAEAVSARWSSWEVSRVHRGQRRTAVQSCPDMPYEMIPADRLYAAARAAIGRASNVDLRLGCAVTGLVEEPRRVAVDTTGGRLFARYVFDSRPPPAGNGRGLVQRFLGQEVKANRPVFDPGRATLMDFAVRQRAGAVRFLYVLPTSPETALVEDTWLASADAVLPDHRLAIRDYLAERYGLDGYEVEFEEEGAIPMDPDLQAPRSTGRVLPIGTAGGAVKPSSGYAFLGIQRMTAALARDLLAGREPEPFRPRSDPLRWMDAVLLDAIAAAPERAPELFGSLFEGCAPGPLVRFLNELGSAADIGRVVAAMPKRPMMTAALRASTRASR